MRHLHIARICIGCIYIFSLFALNIHATCAQTGISLSVAQFNLFSDDDFGVEYVDENVNLGSEDLRVIIARLINTALGFLGILAVIIIIYAGFVWMLSGGNDERRAQARKTLGGAIIGLFIILAANSIVSFFLDSLTTATEPHVFIP